MGFWCMFFQNAFGVGLHHLEGIYFLNGLFVDDCNHCLDGGLGG